MSSPARSWTRSPETIDLHANDHQQRCDGLDVSGLVTRLVAAERAPYDARIAKAESKLTTEVSAMAQLKGAMSSLQSALGTLKAPGDFQVRKVTLGDDTHFAAATTSEAAPGNYSVEVRQLAKAAQLGSAAISGGATALSGTGTLNDQPRHAEFQRDADRHGQHAGGPAGRHQQGDRQSGRAVPR